MGESVEANTNTRPDGDQTAPDDACSQSSMTSDDTQNGVKGIEAVSQTWTKWSLVVAYLG